MAANRDEWEPESGRRSRRWLLALGLLVVVVVVVGVVALRSRGDGKKDADKTAATGITFGPEGDATTIEAPLPGSQPLMALNVNSGAAGTEVTLQGAGFKSGKGIRSIDLFWDRAEGKKLGRVDGPRFSVKLTIPPDAPVVQEGHYVVAVQRDDKGKILSQTSVIFFVVANKG